MGIRGVLNASLGRLNTKAVRSAAPTNSWYQTTAYSYDVSGNNHFEAKTSSINVTQPENLQGDVIGHPVQGDLT